MTIDRAKRTPRRPLLDPDRVDRPVFVLAERYDAHEGPWHRHRRSQLIHASDGVLTVRTKKGLWVVPPQRAVWVPGGTEHRVSSRRRFWLRTLYAEPGEVSLPDDCAVVTVDPLVHELLVAASEFGPKYAPGSAEERLVRVILDRLPTLATAPLQLPHPTDSRLKRIADVLLRDPADPRTLDELAKQAGLVPRTAARGFLRETGLTFGRWRQQRRLLAALEKLGDGESVTAVALDVGYADVSSFIAVFKEFFGTTPARWFR